ncbi:thymidylate kinase [Sphingomonas changbaiensis NBRC 104936]|uniref:Thymidylate kinase n=1 Tax=Sphingomonas changbaiensis NBRC 104936 TaxID=1219043 RepID=A0A0E9MM02_9SPHN|nr:dTMP kinase [Sphingomonas changbaiensis]GAO38528.1 thymidylate kinase [Sphingomonas changbaiensis NBRC 104936]
MSARFISLEGGEGVGKSTQARRLADALRTRGLDVLLTREPGGSPGAEAIRSLLLEGDANRWSPGAEALLFAAARADHVTRTIDPALSEGQWVICDRFLDSSRAYQGMAGGVGDAAIQNLHQIGSDGRLPDRTLVLALTDTDAAARADARDAGCPDRIGGRASDFHAEVAQAFRDFARDDPERIRLVDASGSEGEVTERLLAALADLLP